MAELSSCNQDCMARKAQSIYSLALYRKLCLFVMHRSSLLFVDYLRVTKFQTFCFKYCVFLEDTVALQKILWNWSSSGVSNQKSISWSAVTFFLFYFQSFVIRVIIFFCNFFVFVLMSLVLAFLSIYRWRRVEGRLLKEA